MNTNQTNRSEKEERPFRRTSSTVSAVLENGAIVELVYDRSAERTAFAVWENGKWRTEKRMRTAGGRELVPYSANNPLIANKVVLFPKEPEEYGSERELVQSIMEYINSYVDLDPRFLKVTAYYCLFSWLYDGGGFLDLPYLRVRGPHYGSGKTRFLTVVGAVCFKPVFASAGSSIASLFRTLDAFRGTLVVDETDFFQSDERAQITKLLNCGTSAEMPLLRIEVSGNNELRPRAYKIFGPKLLASRRYFQDDGLESRCITSQMGTRPLRNDIPINLPASYSEEALRLRNKLLLYRFHNLGKKVPDPSLADSSLEPRINQIFVPLLSIINDAALRDELRELAREFNEDMIVLRGSNVEAQVLEVIKTISEKPGITKIAIKEITAAFVERFGGEYEGQVTNRWIGGIVRKQLQLKSLKSDGVFVIPLTEMQKLPRLYERYGLVDQHNSASDQEEEKPEPEQYEDEGSAIDNRDIRDILTDGDTQ